MMWRSSKVLATSGEDCVRMLKDGRSRFTFDFLRPAVRGRAKSLEEALAEKA